MENVELEILLKEIQKSLEVLKPVQTDSEILYKLSVTQEQKLANLTLDFKKDLAMTELRINGRIDLEKAALENLSRSLKILEKIQTDIENLKLYQSEQVGKTFVYGSVATNIIGFIFLILSIVLGKIHF